MSGVTLSPRSHEASGALLETLVDMWYGDPLQKTDPPLATVCTAIATSLLNRDRRLPKGSRVLCLGFQMNENMDLLSDDGLQFESVEYLVPYFFYLDRLMLFLPIAKIRFKDAFRIVNTTEETV